MVSGNPAALSYAVFPVPSNGKISLNTADASQTDAPMSAPINGLKANFKNECGLVKLTVYNLPENADIRLSAKDIAGSLLVNAQDGTILESSATGDEIKIQNAKSGQAFFVPVLAGDTQSQAEFTLSINGAKKTFNATIQKGKVTIDNVPKFIYQEVHYMKRQIQSFQLLKISRMRLKTRTLVLKSSCLKTRITVQSLLVS